MITIAIGDDSCQITDTQLHWFKTLEHAGEYLNGGCVIQLPNEIAEQSISIEQFKDLIDCYQTQITNDVVDYQRPRSILEHYLDGIFDDVNGQIGKVLNFLIGENRKITVDLKLYQLIYEISDRIDWNQYHPTPNHAYGQAGGYISNHLTPVIIWLGSLEIVKHLCKYLSQSACKCACYYGHADILEYLHTNGFFIDNESLYAAISSGHLECLKYLIKTAHMKDNILCMIAVMSGNIDILKYLHTEGFLMEDSLLNIAISYGHFECLKYLINVAHLHCEDLCIIAASRGYIQILKYLHEQHNSWDINVCYHAAQSGNLECLQYAHENGCPWEVGTCRIAALKGHLECLQYAHEHGCPWDALTYQYGIISKNRLVMEYLIGWKCPTK